MMILPTFTDIEKAHIIVLKYAHRTTVLTSSSINKIVGGNLFFKCENFQKSGAFKMRGVARVFDYFQSCIVANF